MSAVRKGDVVITLVQHNAEHDIIIDSIDESKGNIKEILGFIPDDLTGHSIHQLLPSRISENINDFVEYDNFGNDLVNVLKRTRKFAMKTSAGKEVELNMRVQNDVSVGDKMRYMMVIGSKSLGNDVCIKAIQEVIARLPKHEATGLIDVSGFNNALEIVHEHVVLNNMACTVAVIRIDDFSELSSNLRPEALDEVTEQISLRLKQVFRAADILSYLQNGLFGIGLMKTNIDNAIIPLERLKSVIENEPIYPFQEQKPVTISAAYHEINSSDQPGAVVLRVQDVLDENAMDNNSIIKA